MYALRRCRQIHRLIYVSCNPAAAIQNFMEYVFSFIESHQI